MKKIRHPASPVRLGLFVLLTSIFFTAGAGAQTVASMQQPAQSQTQPQAQLQTRQLLDWMGFLALLEQAPLTLRASLDAEAKFRNATPAQVTAWRRELEPRLKPQQLQQDLVNYVAERYRADTFARAERILGDPLSKRVRYFDLAMTQPGAAKTLPELRSQLHGVPPPERRALVEDVDAAAATSLLAAVLQTGVTERVRVAAGAAASDEAWLQAETVERQRFLAPLTADYALYAYRYLRDEELGAYRDLLRDPQLQWLLDVSRQGLMAVVKGEVRPPPDSKR